MMRQKLKGERMPFLVQSPKVRRPGRDRPFPGSSDNKYNVCTDGYSQSHHNDRNLRTSWQFCSMILDVFFSRINAARLGDI
jgi:hypothetical protein